MYTGTNLLGNRKTGGLPIPRKPYDLILNLAFGHGMRSPVLLRNNKKLRSQNFGVLLELLARFELATSSLPRMRSTG